jgi:SAM-dependent methyltransferase
MKDIKSNRVLRQQRVLKGRVGRGVRQAFSAFYPDYSSEDDLFMEQISSYLKRDFLVLDAGCGSGTSFRYPWRYQVRFLVGCDIEGSVAQNTNIEDGVVSDLTALPFGSQTFDLVFCRYVLEHLDHPRKTFTEFSRILKPSGKAFMLTPSKYHYVVLASRLAPHFFHEIISTVRGNSPEDAFPTKYLANSKTDIVRYAEQVGLKLKEYITREVCPNYLLWSLPSFLIGVVYERIVNRFEWLNPLRVSIIAVFER